MNTVFIMGGTGFIGTETVKELVSRGDKVYGLARSISSEQKLRRLGAIPLGSITDDHADDKLPSRLSVEFAVRGREKYIKWANILVQIAREKKVKAAIHVTGTTIYEPREVEWITEQTPLRYTPDGFNRITGPVTRLIVDKLKEGLPFIVAVAPNVVYGPIPNSSFEQVFVNNLRRGQMGIAGHGRNYIPTGHVEDIGRAVAFLTDTKYAGEFFLIAGDDQVTQKEFLYAIAKGIGKKRVMQLPKPIVAILGGKAGAEFMSLSQRVDNSKLKKAGFVFRHPRFLEAIGPVMEQLQRAQRGSLKIY